MPKSPERDPRRAKPGQTVTYTLTDGTERTLKAEETGQADYAVIRPETVDDEGILDTFGFARADKVIRAEKSANAGEPGQQED